MFVGYDHGLSVLNIYEVINESRSSAYIVDWIGMLYGMLD